MNDPRSSTDPNLRAALKAWDSANPFRNSAYEEAMRLRTELRETTSHHAYAWAALAAGRMAAHRQNLDLAEILISEALGRFCLVGDKYGECMAVSHLALPLLFRRSLDRALELALKPLSSDVPFSTLDKALLHHVASQCFWAREESHSAMLHLMKSHELIKTTGDLYKTSAVLGNIGVVLEGLGEFELAQTALNEAWTIQLAIGEDHDDLQLSQLSNLIRVNCLLLNYVDALRNAEVLFEYVDQVDYPATWEMFENMSDAFAFGGHIDRAQYCLDRSRELKQQTLTPFSKATTQVSEAILLEARKQYDAAVVVASEVIDQPKSIVMNSNHRDAAMVLSRSYRALGRHADSEKWKRFAVDIAQDKLLSNILANQLRNSLAAEQPSEPLTEQELTCLSLSAHGQTSGDIALKLGIKTRTVNFHFAKVLRKLNAMNRQEAVAKALNANLLRPSP